MQKAPPQGYPCYQNPNQVAYQSEVDSRLTAALSEFSSKHLEQPNASPSVSYESEADTTGSFYEDEVDPTSTNSAGPSTKKKSKKSEEPKKPSVPYDPVEKNFILFLGLLGFSHGIRQGLLERYDHSA
ncbi:hypothetical protein AA313_de0200719 [Arthrobotrys entomopaga]|nr:hypothetical protein AA313_de0200719 [Arthrobotrys entomopaga]